MICARGKCLLCEKEIAKPCPTCGQGWQNTDQYTHVKLNWSNGSKMEVAVCVDCSRTAIWRADKTQLTQAIWDAWDKADANYSREVVLV